MKDEKIEEGKAPSTTEDVKKLVDEIMAAFDKDDELIVFYKPKAGHNPAFLPTREKDGKVESALALVAHSSKLGAMSLINQLQKGYKVGPLEVMLFQTMSEQIDA